MQPDVLGHTCVHCTRLCHNKSSFNYYTELLSAIMIFSLCEFLVQFLFLHFFSKCGSSFIGGDIIKERDVISSEFN